MPDAKARALAALPKALERRNNRIDRARTEFRAALLRARDAGATYTEIGAAIGKTHVAIMKFL